MAAVAAQVENVVMATVVVAAIYITHVHLFIYHAKPSQAAPLSYKEFVGGTVTCACEMSHNEQCFDGRHLQEPSQQFSMLKVPHHKSSLRWNIIPVWIQMHKIIEASTDGYTDSVGLTDPSRCTGSLSLHNRSNRGWVG